MIDLMVKCFFGSMYILVMLWFFGLTVDIACRAVELKDFLILSAYGFVFVYMLLLGANILTELIV